MSRLLTVIGEEGRSGTVRYGQVSQNDSQLDTVKILDEERFHLRTNQSQDQIESGTDRAGIRTWLAFFYLPFMSGSQEREQLTQLWMD